MTKSISVDTRRVMITDRGRPGQATGTVVVVTTGGNVVTGDDPEHEQERAIAEAPASFVLVHKSG